MYNFQQLYVINCAYISCLENDVSAGLATIDSCTGMYDYATCKFWYGEILGDILGFFGNILKGIGDILVSIVSDPFSLVMIVFNLACGNIGCQSIRADQGAMLAVCQVYQVVGLANQVGQQVKGWIDWSQQNKDMINTCEQVEEGLAETVDGETTVAEETSEDDSASNSGSTTVSEVETSEVEQE